MDVAYSTLCRETPSRQHAFVPKEVPFLYEDGHYLGNTSLCGSFFMTKDGETPMEFRNMDKGVKSKNNFCKNCQRVIDKAFKQ